MILHAKYVNGQVTVTDKNIPKLEADAIIRLMPKGSSGEGFLSLTGIWSDRKDMKDSAKWVNELRRKENERSK